MDSRPWCDHIWGCRVTHLKARREDTDCELDRVSAGLAPRKRCDGCGELVEGVTTRDYGIDNETGYHDTEELCEQCATVGISEVDG